MIPGWRTLRSVPKPWKKGSQGQHRLCCCRQATEHTEWNRTGSLYGLKNTMCVCLNVKFEFHLHLIQFFKKMLFSHLCTVWTPGLSQHNQARSVRVIKSDALQPLHQTFRTWRGNGFGRLAVTEAVLTAFLVTRARERALQRLPPLAGACT